MQTLRGDGVGTALYGVCRKGEKMDEHADRGAVANP